MTRESESNYIERLKTFEFSPEQRQQLLAIPKRRTADRRERLDLALTAIESEIRMYRVDLRLPAPKRGQSTVSPLLIKAQKHACALKEILQSLATDYRVFEEIRYSDGMLLEFAAALERHEKLLKSIEETHELRVRNGRAKGQSGRPRNEYGYILALAVGRELRAQGFELIKSRESLFYKIYVEILSFLAIEKTDPYNVIAGVCDQFNRK